MVDEKDINFYLRKYKKARLTKKIIFIISFILCYLIIFKVSNLKISDLLFYFACLAVVLIIFIFFFVICGFVDNEWYDFIREVLLDECNSKLYVQIYKKISNYEKRNVFITYEYIYALIMNGDYDEAKIVLNKKCKNTTSVQYKENYYRLYRTENTDTINEIRDDLLRFYRKKYSNKQTLFNKKSIILHEVYEVIDKHDYKEALRLIENYPSRNILLESINITYHEGICHFYLKEYSKAKEKFDFVVMHGNTLEFVNNSKKYLNLINIEVKLNCNVRVVE